MSESRRRREEKREELKSIRGAEPKRKGPSESEKRKREERKAVAGVPEDPVEEARERIEEAKQAIEQAESYAKSGAQVTWQGVNYDLSTTQGWKDYNQAIREAKSDVRTAERQIKQYEFQEITSQAPIPGRPAYASIAEVGPPKIASLSDVARLRAEGYDLPEGKTIYISPSGQPYYYEGEIEEPDKAFSLQLWEEAALLEEAETGNIFGVPYSKKGARQIGALLAGSLEQSLTPILRIIPREQPFELVRGEEGFSWRDVEGTDQLDEADKRVMQLTGFAMELGADVGLYMGAGYVSGKVVKIGGAAVSRIPVLGTKATQATKYLLKPRLITTAAIGTGLVASESMKVAELYKEGASLGRISGEVGLDVASMVAYDIGFSKGLGTVPFLESARETIPVKHGKASIPLEEGGMAEWSGLYLSKGDDAVILTGEITVKDAQGAVISRSYVPESNIESRATIEAMKKIGYDPTDIENIEDIRAIISKTQGITSQYIDDVLPVETGTLSEKGVDTVKKFVLEHIDDVEQVYGSYAVRPQLDTSVEYMLKTGDKTISALRTPGDIDIQLTRSPEDAPKFADDLLDDLLKVGETVRIDPESPMLIEAQVGPGKWAHAVDIHAAGDMTDTIPAVKTWGFELDKPSVKIEGLPAMSAAEQGIRKGSSIMGFTPEGGIGPKEHRMKDIPDFFQVQDTLIKSMKLPSIKTRTRLDTLLGRYGGMEKIETLYGGDIDDFLEVGYVFKPPKADPAKYSVASPLTYLTVEPAIKTPSFIEPRSPSEVIKSQSLKIVSPQKPSISKDIPSIKISPYKPIISSKLFGYPTREPSPSLESSIPKISIPKPSPPTIPSPSLPTIFTPSPDSTYPSPRSTIPEPKYPSPIYPEPSYEISEPSYPPMYPQPERKKKAKKEKGKKRRKAAYELSIDFKEPRTFKEPDIPEFEIGGKKKKVKLF